ncbi:MAG: (E)-4-hydroxy-3-methylbut-2-enyl-diphosphate synthase [Chloroflexi bacterium]|nr:(E)-4-hydroxy-3-methylbut-2-enyl-diphosphate synthase [Chloroflexota bacterium]
MTIQSNPGSLAIAELATRRGTLPSRYVASRIGFSRRVTREVMVGGVGVGLTNPIRVQSMTTTDTLDTEGTVAQALRLVSVGCEIVRITAPTVEDARNIGRIRDQLHGRGCMVPLVADIHFNPAAAMEAALHVEKVRINPGNFADSKRFAVREYSDTDYDGELERIEQRFAPLVERCRSRGISMRIGTNHGSLSDRIMNRFGDTPLGMVESALEFAAICRKYGYHDLIFSMKASNPKVMIHAYRLLAARLDEMGWNYPFHLGVTEAGNGQDGRIKSAIGIGSLLDDGIGDTIRVSLTEDPEAEVPVAFALARLFDQKLDVFHVENSLSEKSPFTYERRQSSVVALGDHRVGGSSPALVIHPLIGDLASYPDAVAHVHDLAHADPNITPQPDAISVDVRDASGLDVLSRVVETVAHGSGSNGSIAVVARISNVSPQFAVEVGALVDALIIPVSEFERGDWSDQTIELLASTGRPLILEISVSQENPDVMQNAVMTLASRLQWASARGCRDLAISIRAHTFGALVGVGRRLERLGGASIAAYPVLLVCEFGSDPDDALLSTSVGAGSLLCDGIGDAIEVRGAVDHLSNGGRARLAFNVLQGAGARITKTEYVACPSCGRTLFDLQETTTRIQSQTGHLKGVKIAIMGCIVNGPGEMADADFGYVGGAPGKVNLYVGKECVEKGVPQSDADHRLVTLIRQHGRWVDRVDAAPLQ